MSENKCTLGGIADKEILLLCKRHQRKQYDVRVVGKFNNFTSLTLLYNNNFQQETVVLKINLSKYGGFYHMVEVKKQDI